MKWYERWPMYRYVNHLDGGPASWYDSRMDRLSVPTMSYFDLLTVHQNLLEIHRAHPEDEDVGILLVEAERQRDIAFLAHKADRRSKL